MRKGKNKPQGKCISVSPQAYEKMLQEAYKAKPRLSLREQVNIINKLPKEL